LLGSKEVDLERICAYFFTPDGINEVRNTLGALWVSEHEVTIENASPLVLKAFEWLKNGELSLDVECYEQWIVKKY
jgi:hypothetical protein